MMTKPDMKPRAGGWRLTIGVPLGALVLRVLGLTWRVRLRNDGGWLARHGAGEGSVLALWHGELLPLAYCLRGKGIHVLVSEHRDGEIISRLLQTMGNDTIRGSTSRGGARALAEMARRLRAGKTVAVTPDGPRGPAHVFAPGALVAAQRSGAPVVTLRVDVDRAWRMRSWDEFMIPKPFAKITVAFGSPAIVGGSTPAEAVAEIGRFEALMSVGADGAHA